MVYYCKASDSRGTDLGVSCIIEMTVLGQVLGLKHFHKEGQSAHKDHMELTGPNDNNIMLHFITLA